TLRTWLNRTASKNSSFLMMMAGNALQVSPPLGRIRDFVVEDDGSIDLKKSGARLFVDVARILALRTEVASSSTVQRLREAGLKLGVQPEEISSGEATFQQSCALCHGTNGEGVALLGKPLRNSAFVQSQSDAELHGLLIDGRPISDPQNTSGVLMPPRGAQGIDDDALMDVVAYLRSMQDPGAPHVSVSAWERAPGEDGGPKLAAVELTDHAGYELFVASCAACHGQGGEGMDELGLPLTTSGFVRGKSDKEMVTFIKTGRSSWDENNTTGLDMPPKGGNPAITDDQLQLIVEYIRAIQEEAMGS
ncbi:MAG: c-type cytochrome, partial [Phycisphaerales bacterium]|nr:c-type cytochrome [Phycisphaerales bacterium]